MQPPYPAVVTAPHELQLSLELDIGHLSRYTYSLESDPYTFLNAHAAGSARSFRGASAHGVDTALRPRKVHTQTEVFISCLTSLSEILLTHTHNHVGSEMVDSLPGVTLLVLWKRL